MKEKRGEKSTHNIMLVEENKLLNDQKALDTIIHKNSLFQIQAYYFGDLTTGLHPDK